MLFLIYLFMSVIIKVILKLRFENILLFIFMSYCIITKTFLRNKKIKIYLLLYIYIYKYKN